MKSYILLLMACLISSLSYGQGWLEIYDNGSAGTSWGLDALPTADGGYLTLGDYMLPTGGVRNYHRLIKVDAGGAIQWESIPFEGEIRDDYSRELLPAPDEGSFVLTSSRGMYAGETNKIWLLRYNSIGDTLWTRSYQYGGHATFASTMAPMPDGKIVIAGYYNHTFEEESKAYLLQIDEFGNVDWQTTYDIPTPGLNHPIENLEAVSDGGFVAVGAWDSPDRGHVLRFDDEGNMLWHKEYTLTTGDYFWDILEADNGDFMVCGNVSGIAGISPLVIRLDHDGNELWQQFYGVSYSSAVELVKAQDGGYIVAGSLDNYIWYPIATKGFILKIDEDGNEIWANVLEDLFGGYYRLGSIQPIPGGGYICAGEQTWNHLLMKIDEQGNLYTNQVNGYVHRDEVENCLYDDDETGLSQWIVEIQEPESGASFYTTTDSSGYYEVTIDTGDYTLILTPPNGYWQACESEQTINLASFYDTTEVNFPIEALVDCPLLEIDVSVPFLRRCFDNYYTIHYCNDGPTAATNATISLTLDPYMNMVSSELPYSINSEGLYEFDLGTVPSNHCDHFQFVAYLDCDATVLGQTHCVEVEMLSDSCGDAGDFPIIEVLGECEGDSVVFTLRNIGGVDMDSPANYIVIEDDVMYTPMPYMLIAGEDKRFAFEANGSTFRMEVERYPNSFAEEYVSRTIEGCGVWPFSLGFVNQFPLYTTGDQDIDCQENIGAYDPNDKRAFPRGYDEAHYIKKNTPLEYHIRFQNTGTDTAFNVVIRDTLSPWLDPGTIKVGAASHEFEWNLSGEGILQFSFNNIMLPDSNVNEPASHGYIRFGIELEEEVPLGTEIFNSAAIFFDFNAPVITNTTFHTVGENFVEVVNATGTEIKAKVEVSAYPNPASEIVRLEITGVPVTEGVFDLYNTNGQKVISLPFDQERFDLNVDQLSSGIYFFHLLMNKKRVGSGKLIVE